MSSFTLAMVIATLVIPSAQELQKQPTVECRDMKTTGSELAPNETEILGKACRFATSGCSSGSRGTNL